MPSNREPRGRGEAFPFVPGEGWRSTYPHRPQVRRPDGWRPYTPSEYQSSPYGQNSSRAVPVQGFERSHVRFRRPPDRDDSDEPEPKRKPWQPRRDSRTAAAAGSGHAGGTRCPCERCGPARDTYAAPRQPGKVESGLPATQVRFVPPTKEGGLGILLWPCGSWQELSCVHEWGGVQSESAEASKRDDLLPAKPRLGDDSPLRQRPSGEDDRARPAVPASRPVSDELPVEGGVGHPEETRDGLLDLD